MCRNLYKQISYIIINTGNIKKFDIAKDYLEKAINIIENLFYSSQEFINHYSEIYYLYSIIFEHKGDTEKAYKICADSLSFIEKRNLSRIKPDTLSRQIYLLTGEKDIIIGINKSSSTRDLFEIFQNKKLTTDLIMQESSKIDSIFGAGSSNQVLQLMNDIKEKNIFLIHLLNLIIYYRKFLLLLKNKKTIT